jgi:Uma2 family endonuclease
MNYDLLRKQLNIIGFTNPYIDLIIERVSTDSELRQSIAEVQGEGTHETVE